MKVNMPVVIKIFYETDNYCEFLVKGVDADFAMHLTYDKKSDGYQRLINMMSLDQPIRIEGQL